MTILWECIDEYGDRIVFENDRFNMPEMDGDSLPTVTIDDDAQRSLHEVLGKEIKRKEDIVRLTHKSPFSNDPFCMIAESFNDLWPNILWPNIQWKSLKAGHGITKCDGDIVSQISFETASISIDPAISVEKAVEVLGHELAHVVCYSLGLDDDKHWEKCYKELHEKYIKKCQRL